MHFSQTLTTDGFGQEPCPALGLVDPDLNQAGRSDVIVFLTDLMGGTVQVYFSPLPESISNIRAGNIRALAVTTAKRSQALPDVPTIGDSVPGFEANTWQGIGTPKGTPAEIVALLNKEINAALADPTIKARLAELGSVPSPMSPPEFEKYIVDETEKWAKVIRQANIPLQ